MSLSWNTPPDLFANVVTDDLDRMYRGFCLTVWNNLVLHSPVMHGTYRANHNISFGTPDYSYDLSKEKDPQDSGRMRAVLNAIPQGRFPTVYITNAMPQASTIEFGGYANPVKYGTWNKQTKQYEIRSIGGFSKQAPSGVYGVSFNAAVQSYS